jgi:hypothetical protein
VHVHSISLTRVRPFFNQQRRAFPLPSPQATERIRQGELLNHRTPIVAVTANAMKGDREKVCFAQMLWGSKVVLSAMNRLCLLVCQQDWARVLMGGETMSERKEEVGKVTSSGHLLWSDEKFGEMLVFVH